MVAQLVPEAPRMWYTWCIGVRFSIDTWVLCLAHKNMETCVEQFEQRDFPAHAVPTTITSPFVGSRDSNRHTRSSRPSQRTARRLEPRTLDRVVTFFLDSFSCWDVVVERRKMHCDQAMDMTTTGPNRLERMLSVECDALIQNTSAIGP